MAWLYLVAAGLADTLWAILLKMHGLKPPVLALALAIALIVPPCVGMALKTLPLGTAYAVFISIGTLGTFLAGVFLFSESVSPMRIFFVALIVIGIVGLKFMEGAPSSAS